MKFLTVGIIFSWLLLGCADNNNNPSPAPSLPEPAPELTYTAQIVRTSYGIPHITAQDWGSLGYGYGYAYASDNFCILMKEIVRANGESSRYLGDEGNLDEDFVYKLYNTDEYIREEYLAGLPDDIQQLIAGYTAGVNRYLQETGVDNLPAGEEGCRDAEWARELTDTDLPKMLRKLVLRASTEPLASYITASTGPGVGALSVPQAARSNANATRTDAWDLSIDPALMPQLNPQKSGSNAYALGGDVTRNGLGLLLGNPHFPWQGSNKFYMAHLTVPGEYDVMGSSLHGSPLINIGFNEQLAWTHTVSFAARFTLYEITLHDSDPMQYLYGEEVRDITTETVSVERQLDDDSIETVEHTFYFTHYGPVLDLGSVNPLIGGWPNAVGTIFAVRDANLYNTRIFETWQKMGQADSLQALTDATAIMGIPWVNTLAADRDGNAFYGDISVIPHVSQDQYNTCIHGPVAPLLTDFGLPTLDGADPNCEWGSDEDAPEPGIFGYGSVPKQQTRDYVANANDSYWLPNPERLLEGFPPIIGPERVEQTLRTRLAFKQVPERLDGSDGLGEPGFDVATLQGVLYASRNMAAELILEDLVSLCAGVDDWTAYSSAPGQVELACDILADWDGRSNIDSVGVPIFTELWRLLSEREDLWAVPFSPDDPVHTPNTLNVDDEAVAADVKQALADAVAILDGAGIALAAPWGEVQYAPKGGRNIPIHGADDMFSFSTITTELIAEESRYNIYHGNSYIQTVGWDGGECPDAWGMLVYSQSTDPESDHYADLTQLYAEKGWVDLPFCIEDVEAEQIGDAVEISE